MTEWFSDEDLFCGACGTKFWLDKSYDIWYRFYRVVIVDHAKDDADREVFTLSGIGALSEGIKRDRLYAPREENEIVKAAHDAGYLGAIASNVCTIYPARYWSSQNCQNYPHGYPFHAKCWILVERCLGLGYIAQHQLEHLIIAIRKYWYKNNYDLDKYMPLRDYTCPWVPFVCYRLVEALDVTWPYQVNPVDIPEVKWLIKQSTRTQSTPVKTAKNPQTCDRENYLSLLPLELRSLVLEFLEDIDVKSCVSALGWSIPESHWRRRLGGLIFEFMEVQCDVYINWEFAYFETQQLLRKILGLENRQRIWKALGSVRGIFQNLEKEESSTRLSVFINETYPIYTGPIDPGLKYFNKHVGCAKPFPHTRFLRGDPPTNERCECEKPLS